MTNLSSISSSIKDPLTRLCVSLRYSSTHVMRWSLNVPLMTWWRRSGERSSYISARGKLVVKGWSSYGQDVGEDRQWLVTHLETRDETIVEPQCILILCCEEH